MIECRGTANGQSEMAAHQMPSKRYEYYRTMYENCTEVQMNLEITGFRSSPSDFSFLENVRIVHGYVLVFDNGFGRIPLTSLRVIGGQTLFKPSKYVNKYSLYVKGNDNVNQLDFSSLTGLFCDVTYC